jgi:hypothetical protein
MYSISLKRKEKFFKNVGERIKVRVYMVVMSIERVILSNKSPKRKTDREASRTFNRVWLGKRERSTEKPGAQWDSKLQPSASLIQNPSPFLKLSAINKYLTPSGLTKGPNF